MNKTYSLKHFVYFVELHIYYKMIHGPYNIKLIHKQLKTVHGVNVVDKRTVHHWASLNSGSEKGQADLSDVTVFWDGKEVILVEIMPHAQTIN